MFITIRLFKKNKTKGRIMKNQIEALIRLKVRYSKPMLYRTSESLDVALALADATSYVALALADATSYVELAALRPERRSPAP